MQNIKKNELIAFVIGVISGGVFTNMLLLPLLHNTHSHGGTHQITQPDEEYHIHADFLVYVRDTKINLNEEMYMTTASQELHPDAHLHDDNGEVKHLHQEGVTFVEFLNSLGLIMTNECLTYNDETFCTNDEEQLRLFVNNQEYEGEITDFEINDEDRLLIYYGPDNKATITNYLNEVKDDACYYSGTCLERGVAPPESCGLTCEI